MCGPKDLQTRAREADAILMVCVFNVTTYLGVQIIPRYYGGSVEIETQKEGWMKVETREVFAQQEIC